MRTLALAFAFALAAPGTASAAEKPLLGYGSGGGGKARAAFLASVLCRRERCGQPFKRTVKEGVLEIVHESFPLEASGAAVRLETILSTNELYAVRLTVPGRRSPTAADLRLAADLARLAAGEFRYDFAAACKGPFPAQPVLLETPGRLLGLRCGVAPSGLTFEVLLPG